MFAARTHEVEAPFRGDAAAAFDVARTALLSLGFEIMTDAEGELYAEGPGMHSNREPALLGATQLRLRIRSGAIAATAKLGGVESMRAFLMLFPPGLILVLALVFAISGMTVTWHMFLPVAPWLVLGPWMGAKIEHRTTRAIDNLVRGMATR